MNHQQHANTDSAPASGPDDTTQYVQYPQWAGTLHNIVPYIQSEHDAPWNPVFAGQQPFPSSLRWIPGSRPADFLSEDGTAPGSIVGGTESQYEESIPLADLGPQTVTPAEMHQMFCVTNLGNPGPPMPSMPENALEAASTYSTTTAAAGNPHSLRCMKCDKECSSASSLKKHMKSHSRTNLCNYPDCNKAKEGFSTPNDLQRHKLSVHKEATTLFVCQATGCASQFSRKDNFRQHLRKVHKLEVSNENAAGYAVARELRVPNPTPASNLAPSEGSADIVPTPTNSQPVDLTPMEVDSPCGSQQMTDQTLPDVAYQSDPQEHPILTLQNLAFQGPPCSVDMGYAGSIHSLQSPLPTGFSNQSLRAQPITMSGAHFLAPSSLGYPGYPGYHTSTQQGPPSHSVSAVDEMHAVYSAETSSVFSCHAPRESLTAASSQKVEALSHCTLVNQGWTTSQLVDYLGTFPVELLQQAMRSQQSSEGTNEAEENPGAKSRHQCKQCEKVCNRACELKKHMKRHDRPYGCTVKDCGKSFGSKNDWKRHESSQHTSFEVWACDADGCIAICEDRFSFIQHLREAHDMVHSEDLQPRVQTCRIGGQYDARFWCGFCCRVIGIDDMMPQEDKKNVATQWSRRCDHIDNHLNGKNNLEQKSKSQWRFLEDEAKGEPHERISATASITSSNGVPYKRKVSGQADNGPRKRADGQWTASSF